ncbi:hypothetical protein HanPI659440_Chr14g0553201 [Helianthus annuus]|nr:hypothetical protein HanPI659440_Chr14g0553201 [Helianthus annuus]
MNVGNVSSHLQTSRLRRYGECLRRYGECLRDVTRLSETWSHLIGECLRRYGCVETSGLAILEKLTRFKDNFI